MTPQRVSLITLGVADLNRAQSFYGALGWVPVPSPPGVVFYQLDGLVMGLFPLGPMAEDQGRPGVSLQTGAPTDISPLPVVQGNPAQLRMLVHNLMSNAVKYRRSDVELEIHVDGSILEDGNRTLSIRDNGCGIPETHIDRVFGVFTRLHRHEEIPGTGLGLALCKRIDSNHNGSISVSSTKGQGSTFDVRLAG